MLLFSVPISWKSFRVVFFAKQVYILQNALLVFCIQILESFSRFCIERLFLHCCIFLIIIIIISLARSSVDLMLWKIARFRCCWTSRGRSLSYFHSKYFHHSCKAWDMIDSANTFPNWYYKYMHVSIAY